ncbi:hypothetical protein [Polyangium spumosum]|nr:hypothetical protein [Polyangium spumosum]
MAPIAQASPPAPPQLLQVLVAESHKFERHSTSSAQGSPAAERQ